jgi:hypothetical protein
MMLCGRSSVWMKGTYESNPEQVAQLAEELEVFD